MECDVLYKGKQSGSGYSLFAYPVSVLYHGSLDEKCPP